MSPTSEPSMDPNASQELLSPSDPSFFKGTLLLETGNDLERLLVKLEAFWYSPGAARQKIVLVCAPGQKASVLSATRSREFSPLEVTEANRLRDLEPFIPTRLFAYCPAREPVVAPLDWDESPVGTGEIKPWAPLSLTLERKGPRLGMPVSGWIGETSLLKGPWGDWRLPALRDLETFSRMDGLPLGYVSAPALAASVRKPEVPLDGAPSISVQSKVLALIPHFQCEEWLEGCLESLVNQTRPPDGILVLDDGSVKPPRSLVEKFKTVTLWRSKENGGPYRLIQSAIEKTGYDAYLFQDADDWSSRDRLERLLEEAQRSGAELVGSQEMMHLKESVFPNQYPLDVHQALREAPTYALLHPSSLVSRSLVLRAGGYATGLRFSGDMEFLLRATWVGKAVNLDRYCYFRRIRVNSLITSAKTGLASPARQALDDRIKKRYRENVERAARGQAPLLEPLESVALAEFEEICGPKLLRG
jgi:hypothetical protein